MVDAIYAVPTDNGPSEPKPYSYDASGGLGHNDQDEEYKVSNNALGANEREWNFDRDLKKVPLNLLRKPNRQNMQEEDYVDSIREMLRDRVCLSEDERLAFGAVVRQGMPASLRADFWNLCTGVHMYKYGYCDDYYKTLHRALESKQLERYPNPMFEKFRRDISRAFPNDAYYTADIKESISRIIEAYIWRNPTVGYIQGFNFLVFRLRKVLDEEDTFWTLVMIIETYMPPDYYVEMYGVRTQASIL